MAIGLSIAALLLSLAAFGWNAWTWRRDRETRLRVEVVFDVADKDRGWRIMAGVRVTNLSAHPVTLEYVVLGEDAYRSEAGYARVDEVLSARTGGVRVLVRPADDIGMQRPPENDSAPTRFSVAGPGRPLLQ